MSGQGNGMGAAWAGMLCVNRTLQLCKRWSNLITGRERPRGFQEVELPRFQDNRHMKVVRLSRTGRLYPRKYSWYSFLLEAESTPGPQCGRKIMSMKNSTDTIRNRTRNLQLGAQYLNQLRHRVPFYIYVGWLKNHLTLGVHNTHNIISLTILITQLGSTQRLTEMSARDKGG